MLSSVALVCQNNTVKIGLCYLYKNKWEILGDSQTVANRQTRPSIATRRAPWSLEPHPFLSQGSLGPCARCGAPVLQEGPDGTQLVTDFYESEGLAMTEPAV